MSRRPEKIRLGEFRFVGEQNGLSAQILKQKLAEFFERDKSVIRAYLVSKSDTESSRGTVLVLHTEFGPDEGLVHKIAAIYAPIFEDREHMDIMFLSSEQEAQIAANCAPFFNKTHGPRGQIP